MRISHIQIQLLQTFFLATILGVGKFLYGLDISMLEIFVTFFTVIFFDFLFKNKKSLSEKNFSSLTFPYSGVNAGFGICFFLRSEELILYIVAGCIAIFSKYFFHFNGRHILNPSNAGVFLLLVFFPQYTWVNTLQWGNYSGFLTVSYLVSALGVIMLGVAMTFFVYKSFKFSYLYDYIAPFLVTHFLLFFIIPFSEDLSSFFLFFNTSFFIFTFFMITDPKTVPQTGSFRFFYAISIVLSFYVLNFVINESYAILGSLFVNTLSLPLLWQAEKERAYYVPLIIFVIQVVVIFIGVYILGPPDLVFTNTCNQLFCKDLFTNN